DGLRGGAGDARPGGAGPARPPRAGTPGAGRPRRRGGDDHLRRTGGLREGLTALRRAPPGHAVPPPRGQRMNAPALFSRRWLLVLGAVGCVSLGVAAVLVL